MGFYSNSSGRAFNCTPCERGTFNSARGSSSCKLCPAGTYGEETAMANCTACVAGKSSASVAAVTSGVCGICEFGKFSTGGADSCTLCPSGRYNDDLSTASAFHASASACILCEQGKLSTLDRFSCDVCSSGEFVNTSLAECELCQPGKYAPIALTDGCLACERGTYSSTWGAFSCEYLSSLRTIPRIEAPLTKCRRVQVSRAQLATSPRTKVQRNAPLVLRANTPLPPVPMNAKYGGCHSFP